MTMKAATRILSFLLFILTFQNEILSQSISNKIYLTVENIPKIQHKIATSEFSWRTDKSETVSYKLKNDPEVYPIKLGKNQKRLTRTIDYDLIFLTLRYNPGKYQTYILRRGDSVLIEYAEGKPYFEITNRKIKKHDTNIASIIDTFKFPMSFFEFRNKNRRSRTKEEQKEEQNRYGEIYDQQITMIDSIYREGFLSKEEYKYYRNSTLYHKLNKARSFETSFLKRNDLHISSYQMFLKAYVFKNLKKKTISLGNGVATNSLESFDFVYNGNVLSEENKKYLLSSSLKNIKIDFPSSTYKDRYEKYQSILKNEERKQQVLDDNSKLLESISNTVENVSLSDSNGNLTTLKSVIEAHKGKTVYIDFWASWCAPCRATFPSYTVLKKEYAKEDIVFVFISGDRDAEKWKKAEIKEKLVNSYLAMNYPESKFYQDLELKSFPRYLLFDTSGTLVHDRAPGPDSDTIRSFIDDLLSK